MSLGMQIMWDVAEVEVQYWCTAVSGQGLHVGWHEDVDATGMTGCILLNKDVSVLVCSHAR